MKIIFFLLGTLLFANNIAQAQEPTHLTQEEAYQLLLEDDKLLRGNECYYAERDQNLSLKQRCEEASQRNNSGCTLYNPCTINVTGNMKSSKCRGSVCQEIEVKGTTINNSVIKANTFEIK